jgi:hypothetical protein
MVFYAWTNIVKRLWRFLLKQERTESLPAFLFKLALITFIYLKLSIFQRHHAQERVFPQTQTNASRPIDACEDVVTELHEVPT